MFSKTSNVKSGNGAANAKSNAESIPSLISGDLSIVGTLTSHGDIQVDGSVEGNLVSRAITVGKNASIEGDLTCEKLNIYGAVNGTIRAKDISIMQPARVTGDIYHESLSIEPGAKFTGKVARLEDDTEKRDVQAPVAKQTPAAANDKPFSVVGGKDATDATQAVASTTAAG